MASAVKSWASFQKASVEADHEANLRRSKAASDLKKLQERRKDLSRQLGAMREGGHETDREALRKEIAKIDDQIAGGG